MLMMVMNPKCKVAKQCDWQRWRATRVLATVYQCPVVKSFSRGIIAFLGALVSLEFKWVSERFTPFVFAINLIIPDNTSDTSNASNTSASVSQSYINLFAVSCNWFAFSANSHTSWVITTHSSFVEKLAYHTHKWHDKGHWNQLCCVKTSVSDNAAKIYGKSIGPCKIKMRRAFRAIWVMTIRP